MKRTAFTRYDLRKRRRISYTQNVKRQIRRPDLFWKCVSTDVIAHILSFIPVQRRVHAMLTCRGFYAASLKIDPSESKNWLIKKASEYGRTELVKRLLADSRVNPAVKMNYPIFWACSNGHANTVEVLLADDRVDPNGAWGGYCNCFRKAVQGNHGHVVRLLLTDGRVDNVAVMNAFVIGGPCLSTEMAQLLKGEARQRRIPSCVFLEKTVKADVYFVASDSHAPIF
jgi:hypothetical protein